MQKHVLMIDDDNQPMKYYVDYLRRRSLKVTMIENPDEALNFLKMQHDEVSAIILDIMLPPGSYGHKATSAGLRTGIVLYNDLQTLYPDIPVIVLTSVRNPKTLEAFKEGPLLRLARKRDYPPRELSDLVVRMMENVSDRANKN